uniref:Uncharacterized protein n=1 Tax=Arundo donax TaxID=35708 RepID=A0A0A9A9J9_ARUDO
MSIWSIKFLATNWIELYATPCFTFMSCFYFW